MWDSELCCPHMTSHLCSTFKCIYCNDILLAEGVTWTRHAGKIMIQWKVTSDFWSGYTAELGNSIEGQDSSTNVQIINDHRGSGVRTETKKHSKLYCCVKVAEPFLSLSAPECKIRTVQLMFLLRNWTFGTEVSITYLENVSYFDNIFRSADETSDVNIGFKKAELNREFGVEQNRVLAKDFVKLLGS